MARWKLKTATLVLWPAFGVSWLAWSVIRTCLVRNQAATFGIISLAGFGLGGAGSACPEAALPALRSAVLAPFTIAAVGWGLAHGGALHLQGNMIVLAGMDGGHGTRSTITVGQVVLTSRDELEEDLLAHEAVHGDQWALLGALTPPLYYLSDLIGGGAEHNIFEVSAGLEAGDYAG